MANESTTTSNVASGSGQLHRSTVAAAYSHVLTCASELVEAERDLAGYSGQDPAVDFWIRAAERAFATTLTSLDAMFALPMRTRADQRMLQIARAFRFVMLTDDPAAVEALRRRLTPLAARGFVSRDAQVSPDVLPDLSDGLRLLADYCAIDDVWPDAEAGSLEADSPRSPHKPDPVFAAA